MQVAVLLKRGGSGRQGAQAVVAEGPHDPQLVGRSQEIVSAETFQAGDFAPDLRRSTCRTRPKVHISRSFSPRSSGEHSGLRNSLR